MTMKNAIWGVKESPLRTLEILSEYPGSFSEPI